MKRLFSFFALTLVFLTARAEVKDGSTYSIRSRKFPKKSLFVNNSSSVVGTDIVLWTETDVSAQQWIVEQISDTTFMLKNVYTKYYAAPTAPTQGTILRTHDRRPAIKLVFEPAYEELGSYYIRQANKEVCLTATTGENGDTLSWNEKTGATEQQWILDETEPKAEFTTAIRNEMMDKYLRMFTTTIDSDNRTFGHGSWGEAEQMEVALDAYESTGYDKYLKVAVNVYNYFCKNVGNDWDKLVYTNDYKWYGHDFNDDVMWEIIAVARMGWLTGNQDYIQAARHNFDKIYERAYIPFTGLMRWAESSGDPYGTNSCIAGPTEVAACYLGMAGAGEEYFEKARDLYAAQRYTLANMTTGQVYDAVVWDPSTKTVKSKNEWASTYNQGTMLGAACLLYDHYGDRKYLNDAKKIMQYTKNNLCDENGFIKVCQVNDGDLCGFKGILMRYVRRFILDLCQPTYQNWMEKNAMLAYSNRSERGVTTSAWLTKSTSDMTKNGFSCSTAASAAVNTPLWDVIKSGFDTLQVERFDYHRGLLTTTEKGCGGDAVAAIGNGCWAQYDNVDFGEETAQSCGITITAPPSGATGSVEIYFDKMEGTPAGVCELNDLEASQRWHTVITNITPTTGRHHVFLRFTCSDGDAQTYRADQFCFYTQTTEDGHTDIREAYTSEADSDEDNTTYYDLSGRQLPHRPCKSAFFQRQGQQVQLVIP